MLVCSKAGRASRLLDTPNGEMMFSLRSKEAGGSPFGNVFDLGATRDQSDCPRAPEDIANRKPPKHVVPVLACIMAYWLFTQMLFLSQNKALLGKNVGKHVQRGWFVRD